MSEHAARGKMVLFLTGLLLVCLGFIVCVFSRHVAGFFARAILRKTVWHSYRGPILLRVRIFGVGFLVMLVGGAVIYLGVKKRNK